MAETRPFGIDVSKYQGKIKWDVVAAHIPKVEFVGIRTGISWGYADPWFSMNWLGAKAQGIPRMPYHVPYPWEDVSKQVDNFARIVGSDPGEFPWIVDAELPLNWADPRAAGLTPEKIADSMFDFAQGVQRISGRKPWFYSRAQWVNDMMSKTGGSPPGWLDTYEWWLANYLNTAAEHPGPPVLPRGVSKWLIHQTTSHGAPIGVESLQMDYDRWNPARGKPADWVVGGTPVPPPPCGTVQVITKGNIEVIVLKT